MENNTVVQTLICGSQLPGFFKPDAQVLNPATVLLHERVDTEEIVSVIPCVVSLDSDQTQLFWPTCERAQPVHELQTPWGERDFLQFGGNGGVRGFDDSEESRLGFLVRKGSPYGEDFQRRHMR